MAQWTPEQWAELERLFARAAAMPAAERPGFLERECPDEGLRREVAALLEESGGGLTAAGAAIAAEAAQLAREADPDGRLIGARLGAYRVEAIAGHGGMGAVYRASRDDAEFRQQVAIKLVRVAASSPSTLRRFKQERQILAQLSHPNIARLLDGGSTPDGVPYLVMEFIEGETITEWCGRQAVSVEERLRTFLRVCEGVEFAHRNLIVHRDLKPANILVTKDGTPKLLDFGIAKLLDPAADNQAVTMTSLPFMTPDYAAPEQVRGEPVSAASDVYSLGLILYEMLTGHKAQQLTGHQPATIAKVVCETQPAPPAAVNPQLAGDLDNIIRMAIRKEPERRYASAGDLALDIQRHLDGRPVAARADRFAYRASKFLRRRRAAVIGSTAIAASLCFGLVLAYWLGEPTRRPRVLRVLQLTQTGRVEAASGVVTDGSRLYFTERNGGLWSLAVVPVDGGVSRPFPLPDQFFQPDVQDISPDHSRLLMVAQGRGAYRPLWVVPAAGGAPRRLGDALGRAGAWSRDGSHILFSRGGALFQIRGDGTDCRKLLQVDGEIFAIRSAPPPGPDVLRFSVEDPLTLVHVLWEAASDGAGLHPLLRGRNGGREQPEKDDNGDWIANGAYYVFRSRHGFVTSIWAMREKRNFLPGFNRLPQQMYSTPLDLMSVGVHPDGKRVFFAGGQERRELARYDAARGQFLPFLPGVAGRWVDFSKDGQWVLYTTYADEALWRSRPDGSDPLELTFGPMRVHQPRWSPDGAQIAFSILDKIYVMPSGGGTPELIASGFNLAEPNWSSDGKRLLFARSLPTGVRGESGLYVMDRNTRKIERLPGSTSLSRPAWSPDSRYVAANRLGEQIQLFDFRTQKWTVMAAGKGLGVPFWSHDGRHIYYQDPFEGVEQPIFRVQIDTGKIERMMTSRQIPQSNLTGYGLAGLTPDDAPVATLMRGNSDIYALEVDLP